jgi:pilus assembly protein CpaE
VIGSLSAPKPRVLVLDRAPELAARIRHNVVEPGAVVKACPDLAKAERHLAAGPWDVIVAGPSLMHRAGLRRLSSLHERHPWVALVLALHERPRADLAEIIQVGADDLVPVHADDAEFRRTLARAARITRRRLGVVADGAGDRGRIVMISSASGGCGKTFLATNAAEFLARTTGQPVVVLDLDLQFGEVSTALRLRPEVTITDALSAEADGHDLDEILDDYLLEHQDGFKVLAAPRHPGEADSVTPGDVTRILDVLRVRGAWVVIDTHEGLGDLFMAALEATDHVFTVATPDRPSLVNLGRYLAALEGLGMAPGSISVVLNKAETDTGLDAVDMAAQLGRRFEAIVPYSRAVHRSVNTGVPLIAGEPRSPIAALLTEALTAALPSRSHPTAATTPAKPTAPARKRLLGRRPKVRLEAASHAPAATDAGVERVTLPPVTAPLPPAAVLAAPPPAVEPESDPDPVVTLCDEAPVGELGPPPSALRPAAVRPFPVPRCPRRRPPTVPARPPGRCRRSTDRPLGGPARGRGPPRPREACGPGPPARRRAGVASSEMWLPPADVAFGGWVGPRPIYPTCTGH